MLIVKRIQTDDPIDPKYAVIGKVSGVIVRRFENRINAVEFAQWENRRSES